MRDINVLLDALLTPPRPGAPENSRHFYESARAIVAGYMAWVRFREPPEFQTLGMVHRLLSMGPGEREEFAELVRRTERFAGGLTHIAVERQAQVGKEEGGSNFSTIANQLSFLNYPELLEHTSEQRGFNPLMLAYGDTDLFVVVPEETVEHVKGWLRLWVAIPNAVAGIRPLERDMLIVIDEVPRLGYLKPVMDGYTMAAGKGVHFWCFAQSISALDSTWGKEHRKTLLDLAEVVQILGFPRTDAEGAEEMSKAIGTATFEGRTESRSGSVSDSRVVAGNTQWQAGESFSLVRERLVIADHVLAAECLHGDDTPVPVLAKGKTDKGRAWVYVRDDRPFGGPDPPAALFRYSRNRSGDHPVEHLRDFAGILQADSFAGYNRLYAAGRLPGPVTEIPCWSHARRKFFELADIAASKGRGRNAPPISPLAMEAVKRIDVLFDIERSIKGETAARRHAVREELSTPVVAELETWMKAERAKLSRHAPVAKAMDYMLKRWDRFARFLDDGRICLSNDAAERCLRGIALGRRSWLFAGSDRGGRRAAAMYTLIGTAKLNDVDPQAWLADVLARIAGTPQSRLHELLPWNWVPEQRLDQAA